MESIKEILMTRDDMTAEEADDLIAQAQEDFDQTWTNFLIEFF